MAKKKQTKKLNLTIKVRENLLHGVLFLLLVLSLAGNALYIRTLRMNILTDKTNAAAQASFSVQPNWACGWQDFDKLNAKFNLKVAKVRPYSIYGGIFEQLPGAPVGTHICNMTTDADTERLGSTVKVMYFLNHDDAQKYTQKELEPTKWWSPGTDDDIWRIFSYITIADGGTGKVEKADAYTIKDDMVIQVELPCTKLKDPAACENGVRSYIDVMLKNVDETYGGVNQNPFRGITDVKY